MDLNYLFFRQQVSQFNADNAASDSARNAHQVMANAYGVLITDERDNREPHVELPTRSDAADDLRAQAVSCRRLALGASTAGGSEALRAVAQQFDEDATRVDPEIGDGPGQAAALVRVRMALEHQTAHWLLRRPTPAPAEDAG